MIAVELEPSPAVLLDQTVFDPGGGGQPPDVGSLTRPSDGTAWTVIAAHKAGGEIIHDLAVIEGADGVAPAEGDVVTAEIDWPRRHLLMRTHTALHVLCGVVWRDYGAQVTGGNMEPGAGRMDFGLPATSRRAGSTSASGSSSRPPDPPPARG